MRVSMKEMMSWASPGEFAIGAFHAANLEQVQGLLEAAVEVRSPVIIAVDQPSAMNAGLGTFLAMARELASQVPVPAAVLLDRAGDPDIIEQALALGYSGINADLGSHGNEAGPLVERLAGKARETKAFFEVSLPLAPGASHLATGDSEMTSILETGPDSVCLSLDPQDRERAPDGVEDMLSSLVESTSLMVSLAGAGAWPEEDVKGLIRAGAWKLSVGTRLNQAFTRGLKEWLAANPDRINPAGYLAAARESYRIEALACLKTFASHQAL